MKKFYFSIPVNEAHKVPVLNPKYLGDLEVFGTYHDIENWDYESIYFTGKNLLPLLDTVGDVMALVDEATIQHLAELRANNYSRINQDL